jgi:hypothetical protein
MFGEWFWCVKGDGKWIEIERGFFGKMQIKITNYANASIEFN